LLIYSFSNYFVSYLFFQKNRLTFIEQVAIIRTSNLYELYVGRILPLGEPSGVFFRRCVGQNKLTE